VFQRTPNWCAPLHNSKIDPEAMAKIKAGYKEMFQRCQETMACFIHTPDPRGTFEVTPEEREAFWEQRYTEPGFGIWQGNFRDILTDTEANAAITGFVARKIRQRVNDPKVAEKLIPRTTASVPAACRWRQNITRPTTSPTSCWWTSTKP
jgi:hypothetical protein